MSRLTIDVTNHDGAEIVTLSGRLDATAANDVRSAIASRALHGCRDIVVDMKGVSFVDSSGFGAIVAALVRVQEYSARLRLLGMQPSVRKCFEMVKLNQVFEIVEAI